MAERVDSSIRKVLGMSQLSWREASAAVGCILACSIHVAPVMAQEAQLPTAPQATETVPMPTPMIAAPPSSAMEVPPAPRGCPAPEQVLQGPIVNEGQSPPQLKPGQVQEGDVPLAINLPTAPIGRCAAVDYRRRPG